MLSEICYGEHMIIQSPKTVHSLFPTMAFAVYTNETQSEFKLFSSSFCLLQGCHFLWRTAPFPYFYHTPTSNVGHQYFVLELPCAYKTCCNVYIHVHVMTCSQWTWSGFAEQARESRAPWIYAFNYRRYIPLTPCNVNWLPITWTGI